MCVHGLSELKFLLMLHEHVTHNMLFIVLQVKQEKNGPEMSELENGHVKLTNLGYDPLKGQKLKSSNMVTKKNDQRKCKEEGSPKSEMYQSKTRTESRSAHLSNPGAEKTDTNLPVVIEVGVKSSAALRQVTKERRNSRIDIRKLDIKEEESILIWSAVRALNES